MRLNETLTSKKKDLLNLYCTAGFPEIDSLPVILQSLADSGVDMVEIGIPYSDPIADGATIQKSNSMALKNGISLELIFDQLDSCSADIPRILMGYFNSVFQFGLDEFCRRCQNAKVDAVILPDLPVDLYEKQYRSVFSSYGIDLIFLVTPQTSDERIRFIDSLSTSFIYAVSSASTTGTKTGLQSSEAYLDRLSKLDLKNPLLVGFNISSPEDLEFVGQYANGGIIGSAFINYITQSETSLEETCSSFVQYLRS